MLGSCSVLAGSTLSDAKFEPFLEWFRSHGGKAPSLGLRRFEGMGTGVLATSDVREKDLAFSVPMDLVMCRKTLLAAAEAEGASDLAKAMRGVRDDEDLVSVVLAVERARGADSMWAPYIAILPTHVPQTAQFSNEELGMVQDASVVDAARARRRELSKRFEGVRAKLLPLLAASAGISESDVGEADFKWAMSLVNSRALTLHGKKYLVPFADMFNYAPHAQERTAQSGANFLNYHKIEADDDAAAGSGGAGGAENKSGKRFNVFVDRDTAAGEQLFEDYGDNDNRLYLEHHGFVADHNPFDCVHVDLPKLLGKPELVRIKRKLLEALSASRVHNCVRPGGEVSRRLYARMVVAGMDGVAVNRCKLVLQGKREPSLMQSCLGKGLGGPPGVDANARRALQKAAHRMLTSGQFTTTEAEDEALLAEGGLSEHASMAVRYRLSRKRLLRGIVDEVAAELGNADDVRGGAGAGDAAAAGGGDAASASSGAVDPKLVAMLERFNKWFNDHAPTNLLRAEAVPGMRIGTMATADIAAEELYIRVPNEIIMSPDSAVTSDGLKDVFADLKKKYPRGDRFHELLFHLMYERFVVGFEKSRFGPYLETLPTSEEMGFPLFYTPAQVRELEGSLVRRDVIENKRLIDRKYDGVKGAVLDVYKEVLLPEAFTRDNYRWAHAVMDSRSIWWNSDRHLVPMLDLINCVEGPDPTRVHSTTASPDGTAADTFAPWAFKQGEQVYENYGQPNYIYFSYHGFSLDNNTHDCVRIEVGKSRKGRDGRETGPATPCLGPQHGSTEPWPRELRAALDDEGVRGDAAIKAEVARLAQKALDGYPTTLEQDVAQMAGARSFATWVDRAPVAFRATEKRVLRRLAGLPQVDEAAIAAQVARGEWSAERAGVPTGKGKGKGKGKSDGPGKRRRKPRRPARANSIKPQAIKPAGGEL